MGRDADARESYPGDDHTRLWLLSGSLVFAAILLAVGLGLFSLHRAARARLDEAMSERLVSVARTASHLVDGDSLRDWSYDRELETLDFILLQESLYRIRGENRLAELTLCDADGFVLISAQERIERGEWNPYLELDAGAVTLARSGFPAAGSLTLTGGIYQKSAHAPIFNLDGEVVGLMSVDAEADYFDALTTLNRGAWITGGIVLLVLVALAIVLGRLLRDIVRFRASLAEQDKLAAMGRMTAGIAHEIRNPLGVVRIAGESLAQRLGGLGEDTKMAGYIVDEVDRLDRILTRYLTFGRGGGLTLEAQDLEIVVRRTVRDLSREWADDGVTATVTVMGSPWEVQFDSPSLQQVLLNLLLNAREAIADRDVREVVVTMDYRHDCVVLDIVDTGPGLESGDAEDFFTPFHTTKEKGSGLGLAVVRQVVADHGGTVTLHNRDDGDGAVARIVLPAAVDKEA